MSFFSQGLGPDPEEVAARDLWARAKPHLGGKTQVGSEDLRKALTKACDGNRDQAESGLLLLLLHGYIAQGDKNNYRITK